MALCSCCSALQALGLVLPGAELPCEMLHRQRSHRALTEGAQSFAEEQDPTIREKNSANKSLLTFLDNISQLILPYLPYSYPEFTPQADNGPGELYKVQVTQTDPPYITILENPSMLNVIRAVTRNR